MSTNSVVQPDRELAAHFACWHVAGPLEAAGLDLEREGAVVTVWLGDRMYTVSVAVAPRRAASVPLVGRLLA